MNVKKFTLFAAATIIVSIALFSSLNKPNYKYFPRNGSSLASASDGFLEYTRMIKANQITGDVNPSDVARAKQQANKLTSNKSLNINWSFKGPDDVGGRTRAIVVDRNNTNHILACGVAGGVWESFDAAATWQPYDPDFTYAYVNAIVQDANGDFFIGTGGHFEGGQFGAGAQNSKGRGNFFVGSGIHKLSGSGTYETIVAPDYSVFNANAGVDWATIGEIAADPTEGGKLYVAANQGFRVIDINQNDTTITSPINYDQKCQDVAVAPNGNILVTFKEEDPGVNQPGRVYASTDDMQSWEMTEFPAISGQVGAAGRIEGVIAPSDPNVMYLSIAQTNRCLYGLYRSQDAGVNWELIEPGGSQANDPFGNAIQCQGYWDNLLAVSPTDPGKIFIGGVTLHTWEQSSIDPAPSNGSIRQIDVTIDRYNTNGFIIPNYVHADKHTLVFDPTNSDIAYVGTDGGVSKSLNISSQGPTFTESNFGYGVTAFYDIGINGNDLLIGGAQDNGSQLVGLEYNSNQSGLRVLGGDGFDAEMSVIDPSIGVATLYFNVFRRIQGIGTTLGNTNISTADPIGNNPFYGGLCGPISCGGPFYTSIKLWESFDHAASTDSVEFQEELMTPPPIPMGTVIEFEGNNNKSLQTYTLPNDIFPFDTITGGTSDTSTNLSNLTNNKIIINYDTIFIDTANLQLLVDKYDGTNEVVSFTFATGVSFNGTFSNQTTNVLVFSDGNVDISYPQVTFRYRYQVQDRVQSILASANWAGPNAGGVPDNNQRNILITRDLLKVTPNPKWFNIAGERSTPDPIRETVLTMAFSRDGNYLFVGTSGGKVFRISDLDSLDTDATPSESNTTVFNIQQGVMAGKCKQIGSFGGRAVTGIAVDPNDANNVYITLGNYGNVASVARTDFALTAGDPVATFTVVQGNLPSVPAYAVMIDKNNSERVLIGTDLGVFGTDEAFSAAPANITWTEENTGLGRVPVYAIEQMVFDYTRVTNDGVIYIGTHGRGAFKTDQFVGLNENSEDVKSKRFENSFSVYPNPATDRLNLSFETLEQGNVEIQLFDLQGKMILSELYRNLSSDKYNQAIDISNIPNGTYIVRAISGNSVASSKLIVYK